MRPMHALLSWLFLFPSKKSPKNIQSIILRDGWIPHLFIVDSSGDVKKCYVYTLKYVRIHIVLAFFLFIYIYIWAYINVCVCLQACACVYISSNIPKCKYIYIYIYIYINIYIYIYIYWQHFFVKTNFIKHNRHFMSTYFLLDPFEFPYYFYLIRGGELIYVLSLVVCIPSTFWPILGHHQGRIYYKSDVTFVLTYYYYVRASLPFKIMAFAFKCVSIISVSS